MLKDLVQQSAEKLEISPEDARQAIGILLSTIERQGTSQIEKVFSRMSGARTLAAATASTSGLATGPIARLIEQTPGGRRHVAMSMFSRLHKLGLGHGQIADLLGCVRDHVEHSYGIYNFGHLGDLFGTGAVEEDQVQTAAVA